MQFPEFTKKQFGINAVEYVNSFFKDKAKDQAYLKELKKRCDDNGIRNVLIMCDGEGSIGATEDSKRDQTVENHKKWIEAAKFLGCTSIRVNAHGPSRRPDELLEYVCYGLTKISTFARPFEINVIVENHGGLSSNGAWLASVMKRVNLPNCGMLPDFGNFHGYDRYKGIQETIPFAKGVSVKSHEFNKAGKETQTDFWKAMKVMKEAGYSGYVGIEYEGKKLDEIEGVKATQKLLTQIQPKYATL